MLRPACLLLPFALAACALAPAPPAGPVSALLLGEQHDAPEHQQFHRQVVESLAQRGLLAAVVLEMALGGRSTQGLPIDSGEQQVRAALGWNDDAWPWALYGPAVMAAVRAGAPVIGASLDPAQMKAAMTDKQLDRLLPEPALRAQREAIRAGHCGMLADTQLPAMTRVQVARDRAMAQVIQSAVVPGKTVVLLAGSGHVDPAVGVPVHMANTLRVDAEVLPRVDTGKDYCAEFRKSREKSPA